MAIIADGFEESEERNFVVAEAGPCLVGANVLDENGSGGESREKKALPEALASLQPLVSKNQYILPCSINYSSSFPSFLP